MWSLLATRTCGGKGSPSAHGPRVSKVSFGGWERGKGHVQLGACGRGCEVIIGRPGAGSGSAAREVVASSRRPLFGFPPVAGVLRGGLSAVLLSELGVLLAPIAPCCSISRASRLGSSAKQGGKASVQLMYKHTRSVKLTIAHTCLGGCSESFARESRATFFEQSSR